MRRLFDRRLTSLLVLIVVLLVGMITLGAHETLDQKLYYSGDQARALLRDLSDGDKRIYLFTELVDLVFLSTYTGFLTLGLRRVYRSRAAIALGWAPGLFDLIETLGVITALTLPGEHTFLDWLGIVTFIKWTVGLVAAVAFIAGAVMHRQSRTA